MSGEKELGAFGDGDDWHLNAIVSHDHFSSSDMAYIWGYEAAVGSLTAVARSLGDGGEPYPGTYVMIDTIVYPQIFCARHFAELSLKCMLKRLAEIGGKDARVPIAPIHDLSDLLEDLVKATQHYAPDVLPYVEKMRGRITELSAVDEEGDAFRYALSKGAVPHLADVKIINVERFQNWFDKLRKLVHDVFFAIDYELDELDKGGATKHYKRDDLADLARRLPKIDEWNHSILRPFHQIELTARPDMSYTQFQRALSRIRRTPWLSIEVGQETPLLEVKPDLFSRVLDSTRSSSIALEEWGALYCIFKIGRGEVPEEYLRMMTAAKNTAIELNEWESALTARRSTMTEEEIEAENERAFSDLNLSFDTSRMQIYYCEAKIRDVLPRHAYIFCRGLDKLGQPMLLSALRLACDKADIIWAEPPPPESKKATKKPKSLTPKGEPDPQSGPPVENSLSGT